MCSIILEIMKLSQQKFAQIYQEQVKSIFRFIYLRTNSKEIAEDLTANVFLKYWKFVNSKTTPVDNPRAFLYQTARHILIDYYRQNKNNILSLDEKDELAELIPDQKLNPAQKNIITENIKKMQLSLSQLKSEYQEVLIWKYLDKLKTKEIARIIDRPPEAVRTLASRALKALRKIYEESN
ncbi:MAG TPA: sigma-70 family RNA polymerase sigma factor [Candidatus Portnoybacteria bacterium]|nr:sigma-70 family RNA polymerase sigma factor [Candidatus Portnoybacteria bacterium]